MKQLTFYTPILRNIIVLIPVAVFIVSLTRKRKRVPELKKEIPFKLSFQGAGTP